MARVDIRLLGGFNISHHGEELKALRAERLTLLFTYLLLHSNLPVSRKQLAFLFWPDSSKEQARTNLRNLLHLLRHAFPEIDAYFEVGNLSIQRRSDASIQLDVDQFRRSPATMGTDLYFGGPFSQTADGAVKNLNNLARFDTATGAWSGLPNDGLNAPVHTFEPMGTDLYMGGDFSSTGDGAVQNLWQIAKFGAPLLYRAFMPLVTR